MTSLQLSIGTWLAAPFRRVLPALTCFLLISAFGLPSTLFAQLATARFSPERIYIDETATYEISISGAHALSRINVPNVDSLEFLSQNQNSSVQIINGRMSSSLTYSYRVRALKPGTITIPGFHTGDIQVPAATLEVLPLSEDRQRQLEEQERRQRESQREVIGMDLEIPSDNIYVGQAVPAKIFVYSHGALFVELASRPSTDSDAILHSSFGDNPGHRQISRRGQRYNELTWSTLLTPIKTGTFPLQFKESVVVGQGFFNRRQVELSTDEINLDILPLPSEGRPDSFTGAIGTFSILRPEIDANRGRVGEPITLRITINGEGNFARIAPPPLLNTEGWRTYPPEENFHPEDELGFSGRKTFDYIIIPQHTDISQIPQVSFSFFNPETAEYIELTPPPLPIEVAPAPPGSRPTFEPRKASTAADRGPTLLPLMPTLGRTISSITPVFVHPAFLAFQTIPAIAITSLFIVRRRQRLLESNPAYARQRLLRQQRDHYLKAATQAAHERNHTRFFDQARHALQIAIGIHLNNHEASALTLHDCEEFLRQHKLDTPDTLDSLRICFEQNDAIAYGRMSNQQMDLNRELQRLRQTLSHLDSTR